MTTLSAFTRKYPIHLVDEVQHVYYFNFGTSKTIPTINSLITETSPEQSQISSPKPEKKEMSVKAKRDSTNRDACQQLFLISLLLQFNYTVIIRKPRKKSTKTLQLFVIDRIMNPSGTLVFDINDFSSTSTDEKINRRNLDSYTNATMIKLLKEHNGYVEIKKGKKAEKTSQFDRIERVNIENQIYSYSHIKNIGNAMNEIIRNNIQNNNFVFRHDQAVALCM